MEKVYYDTLIHEDYTYIIACTDKGLAYIGGENETLDDIRIYFPKCELEKNETKNKIYKKELQSYFLGKKFNFDFNFDLRGTEFQKEVWAALLTIKYGELVTYKDVSLKIGREKSHRAVANAIGKNPVSIVIPCHRVIGSDGKLRGYRGGLDMKKRLLTLEKNFYLKK